jgi:hypothetical protein
VGCQKDCLNDRYERNYASGHVEQVLRGLDDIGAGEDSLRSENLFRGASWQKRSEISRKKSLVLKDRVNG